MRAKPKSLRFTEEEQAEIGAYVRITGEPEAIMMERLAMRGLRAERLERRLMAYSGGGASSDAAAIAGAAGTRF